MKHRCTSKSHSSPLSGGALREGGAALRLSLFTYALAFVVGCPFSCEDADTPGKTSPVTFRGETSCGTDSEAPRLVVTLAPGECAFVRRCRLEHAGNGVLRTVEGSTGFAIDEDAAVVANNRTHGRKIMLPPSAFVSESVESHAYLQLRFGDGKALHPPARDAAAICAKRGIDPPVEVVRAWAGFEYEASDATKAKAESFAMEFYVTIRASAPDAGVADSGTSPDAGSAICGDTRIEDSETCDDGNTTPNDGCSASCQTEAGWHCPFMAACEPICGDGLVVGPEACDPAAAAGPPCTSECKLAPAVTVGPAYISPELPPGVTAHFTGVTQFILAELSSADATLSVASCTDSLGACTTDPFDVSPAFGSPPTAEITLPFLMGEDTFDFELEASMHGATSDPYPLEVVLQAGDGELKCEQWTNGLPGSDEQRRFGLRLEAEGGAPILEADYYIYQRFTDDQGWPKFRDPDVGASSAEVLGNSTSLSIDANFLVIAVDRGSTPPAAVAARQFRWDDPPHMRTQGCMPCSRGAGGSCRIIPPF